MRSYPHACHAGNFTDAQKHLVSCWLVWVLQREDSVVSLIDTTVGSG